MKPKAVINWSGGKDSALALWAVWQAGAVEVVALLTTVNEAYGRIAMHGVREDLLEAQAEALGLPLIKAYLPEQCPMDEYDAIMRRHLEELRGQGVTHAVFGDIFLEDLRRYREERLAEAGLTAVFPLWQIPTAELARRFVADGFRAYTVCVNEKLLGRPFVGREMDTAFFASLPANVDPCGENGEYHSFVYDGPIFHHPIPCRLGEIVQRSLGPDNETYDTRFWYADLIRDA
ncbi:MAG: diphthine--ammonia ligase [Chloroflexi bacterium]|nr:diphthine--ammonia ligase [Chloroflexota bacterium]